MPLPLRLPLLAFAVALAAAPAWAQTCSDGTWGVRTSVSRAEVSGDTLRLCFALVGDPTETVGGVQFSVYYTLPAFAGVDWEDPAPASSPFNQPPYVTSAGVCLATPECDNNFHVGIGALSGPYRSFPEEPVDVACPTFLLAGPISAAGVDIRGVSAMNGAGASVPACPPGDQAVWGAPVAGEPGPDGAALALTAAPNPVRGAATVGFALPAAGPARLALLDVLGREVAVLADGVRAAGPHDAALDAAALQPGVYLLRLEAGGAVAVRRVTVAR